MDFLAVRTVNTVRAIAEEHLAPFEVQTAPQPRASVVAVVVERSLVTAASASEMEGLCRAYIYDEAVPLQGQLVDGSMFDFEYFFEYLFE